jgi:hypothetical protein
MLKIVVLNTSVKKVLPLIYSPALTSEDLVIFAEITDGLPKLYKYTKSEGQETLYDHKTSSGSLYKDSQILRLEDAMVVESFSDGIIFYDIGLNGNHPNLYRKILTSFFKIFGACEKIPKLSSIMEISFLGGTVSDYIIVGPDAGNIVELEINDGTGDSMEQDEGEIQDELATVEDTKESDIGKDETVGPSVETGIVRKSKRQKRGYTDEPLVETIVEQPEQVGASTETNEENAETAVAELEEEPGGSDQEDGNGALVVDDPLDAILELIRIRDDSLKYLGFDPRATRKRFLERNADMSENTMELITVFSAYAHIGNNITKLSNKRVDIKVSKEVASLVNRMGVQKKAEKSDSFTLPRLAIAFMPEYLIYRMYLTMGLQNLTTSTVPLEFKDLAFAGCSEIHGMPGYDLFWKEYSSLIVDPGNETDVEDKDFLSKLSKWKNVATTGYLGDTDIHDNVRHAMVRIPSSRKDAFNRITLNLTGYKNLFDAENPQP